MARLRQPMATLVLHYDQNVTSVCEATGLISPLPSLVRLLAAKGWGGGQAGPARCQLYVARARARTRVRMCAHTYVHTGARVRVFV